MCTRGTRWLGTGSVCGPQHPFNVASCFTSTGTARTITVVGTESPGRPPPPPPFFFHIATELCVIVGFFQCCFTSTETTRTIRDGEPRTAISSFTQLLAELSWPQDPPVSHLCSHHWVQLPARPRDSVRPETCWVNLPPVCSALS